MNRRFVKLLVALSLCLVGCYLLAAHGLLRESFVTPFGLQPPPELVLVGGLGVLLAGMQLARHAIREELSITSD